MKARLLFNELIQQPGLVLDSSLTNHIAARYGSVA